MEREADLVVEMRRQIGRLIDANEKPLGLAGREWRDACGIWP